MDFPTKKDFDTPKNEQSLPLEPLDIDKAVEETLHHLADLSRKGYKASGLELSEWMATARAFVEKAKGRNYSLNDTNNETKGADIAEAIKLSLNVTPLLLQKLKAFLQKRAYTPQEQSVLKELLDFVEAKPE